MAVPKVNEKLLEDLEAMGFPQARSTRALYYSGNTSLEDAITWIIDHENDTNIDEMPLVDIDINIETTQSFPITEEMRMKALKLREQEKKKKANEEKMMERKKEKERIEAGKKLLDAKRIAEENERKRNLAFRKEEKEEEKRARENIRKKLEQDKLNRRSELGFSLEGQATVRSPTIAVKQEKLNRRSELRLSLEGQATVRSPVVVVKQEKKLQTSKPIYTTTKVEHLRECLRSLKRKHQGENARVRRAFETLLMYVGNVVKNPKEEKYRKIRLSNPLFQERVGSMNGGVEFLELCGFERKDDLLYLPHEKVDMELLSSAGFVLNSAMTNPFFGLLST